MVNLTSFSILSLIESRENTWWNANGNAKEIYICGTLPFTALEVYPTMTTSAAEKPGNVKRSIGYTPRDDNVLFIQSALRFSNSHMLFKVNVFNILQNRS